MRSKLTGLAEAAQLIRNGDLVAMVGRLDMSPMALCREIVRQGIGGLRLVLVPSGGLNADFLVGAGAAVSIETGGVSFGEFGFAPNYTRLAQAGGLDVRDSS